VSHDRPVFPWVAAWGTFLVVAGLVALLALHAGRARRGEKGARPDAARIARVLRLHSARAEMDFPPALEHFVESYLGDTRAAECPTVARHFSADYWPETGEGAAAVWSYCYVSGLSEIDRPGDVIAFDEDWNHDAAGVNVLHVGGNVHWTGDVGAVRGMVARRRGGGERELVLPWWSRHPDPPPFFVPPPPEDVKTDWGGILAAAFGAGALAACAFSFGILAWRRWSRLR
jgi:hypothetical protein